MKSKKNNETQIMTSKAEIFSRRGRQWLCIAFTAFFAFFCAKPKTKLLIKFKDVTDLHSGSEVFLGETTIGEVSDLKWNKNGILVEIKISNDIYIPKGSAFIIERDPLRGLGHLKIEPGKSKVMLTANDTIIGSDAFTMKSPSLLRLMENIHADTANQKGNRVQSK